MLNPSKTNFAGKPKFPRFFKFRTPCINAQEPLKFETFKSSYQAYLIRFCHFKAQTMPPPYQPTRPLLLNLPPLNE